MDRAEAERRFWVAKQDVATIAAAEKRGSVVLIEDVMRHRNAVYAEMKTGAGVPVRTGAAGAYANLHMHPRRLFGRERLCLGFPSRRTRRFVRVTYLDQHHAPRSSRRRDRDNMLLRNPETPRSTSARSMFGFTASICATASANSATSWVVAGVVSRQHSAPTEMGFFFFFFFF